MLNKPLCKTCGTQYPSLVDGLKTCVICSDDRQYITEQGQVWIESDDLAKDFSTKITRINDQLFSLKIVPDFAIGQRAFLIVSEHGNILWDCIPLLDEPTQAFIKSLGGLSAIAISHPHYYSNMNEWAEAFDCPVFVHETDQEWILDMGKHIWLWSGNSQVVSDSIIINTGGHFPGSCVLKVPALSKNGVVFCGDSLFVSRSKRHIAVMYSFPNMIMLSKRDFLMVYEKTKNLTFDTVYGAFEGQNLIGNAGQVFNDSMKRYLESYGIESEAGNSLNG